MPFAQPLPLGRACKSLLAPRAPLTSLWGGCTRAEQEGKGRAEGGAEDQRADPPWLGAHLEPEEANDPHPRECSGDLWGE